ncbi:MAG: NADH-quinone oxidoreductase subunit M [Acidimicrobiia bacterium]|nr:NADH-quinone oxidoreductase subunit M [Acidimicrobiia bacterium]
METFSEWGLSAAIFLPLVGVAVMMAFPKSEEATHKVIALGTSLIIVVIGIVLMIDFDYDNAGEMQWAVDHEWISIIDANYSIGIDGMSLPLLLLTMLITPLVIIYSWNHFPAPHNPKAFLILILVLHTGMIGTFVARDLVLFFVFFEVVLLPMFFMIAVWGGEDRKYASLKFFLYTLFGSALMLVSFLALYFLAGGETFSIVGLSEAVVENGVSKNAQLWIFGGMLLGFGIKVPMFPFHTWLPDAHTQAPTQGSVILAAVLLKLGTYGFVRIAIPILPEAAVEWAPWIGLLAVIGIIYGALGCLAQTDMKRLIAFSSVAHMGYVMLGIATLTDWGINAAIFGMVAHGLITGMLFFVAGSVKERYHTLEIARLGGLLKQAPRMGWILGFISMASLGLPGLAGFWGEFPAILAAYNPANGLPVTLFRVYMVIAAIGTVLAAGYLLWLLQRTAFGEPSEEFADDPHIVDTNREEWLAWTPLLVLILLFGLVPGLIFNVTDPAVQDNLSECLSVDLNGADKSQFDVGLCESDGIQAALASLDVVTTADGE